MAGDWLKLRTRLHEEPAVIRMASITGLDVFSIVGRLAAFWGWAGEHTVTGELRCVTLDVINARVAHEKFAEAMQAVGWLEIVDENTIRVPKWKEYNSKSSKERALSASRSSRYRAKKSRAHRDGDRDASVTNHASREEKRREEKSIKTNTGDKPRFVAPTVEEVAQYCRERGNSVDPESFVDFYTAKDWKIGKNTMKNWQAAVRTWEKNRSPAPAAPKSRVPTEEDLANWNPHAPLS